MHDVVIVGAGPAGLMAGIFAARLGARVLILERMREPLRKLRITCASSSMPSSSICASTALGCETR
jgi:flavin-dependent dehydrogenase